MAIDPTLRADVQAFSSKQGLGEAFAEATRQQGLFDGQTVTLVDANSLIANSAEEVGFMHAENLERSLAERKDGSKEKLRASATTLANVFVNLSADSQAGRKLHAFMEALKQMGDTATGADIRKLLQEYFKDASDQFAALSFAEESLQQQGGHEELLATVRDVKAQLMKEAGAAIRSGLNIAADVLAYAKQGLEGADALRDMYRFAVLGGQTIAAIYTSIMERYGPTRFFQSLEFLLRAAASDLEGKVLGSSLDSTELKAVIDDIYHVQSLGNLHRALGDVLDNTRRLYPQSS